MHVVDSLIPTSAVTIAFILEGNEQQYGTFKDLLDAAELSHYLNRNNSRTVFAPTNAAFDNLRNGVVDCLLEEENRWALNYLLLIHVTYPAEYTSSLSLRSYISTFSGYFLRVRDINGTVHLTRNEIPLEGADTPARNGVIHTLGEVIVPPCIDLDELCPESVMPTPTPTPTPSPSPTPVLPPFPLPPIIPGVEDPPTPTSFPLPHIIPDTDGEEPPTDLGGEVVGAFEV